MGYSSFANDPRESGGRTDGRWYRTFPLLREGRAGGTPIRAHLSNESRN